MDLKIVLIVLAFVVIGGSILGDSRRLHRIKLKPITNPPLESVVKQIYASIPEGHSTKSTTRTVLQNLVNQETHYYGEIGFGTPEQKFRMLFDTGSADTWILSSRCTLASCARKRKFDDSLSSSFNATDDEMFIEYGNGHILVGQIVKDTVSISGVGVVDQHFAVMDDMANGIFHLVEMDGIVGMGFRAISLSNSTTLFENMLQQGVIIDPIFSFHLSDKPGREPGGELVFGGIDEEFYTGQIHYAPLTQANYWEIKLDSVYLTVEPANENLINDQEVIVKACPFGCRAIVDTGTALIQGHHEDVDQIHEILGAVYSKHLDLHVLPHCDFDKYPNLVFSIAGQNLILRPHQYTIKLDTVSDDNHLICATGLKPISHGEFPMWIMGKIFLTNFYTIFDYGNKRVGFAITKD